MEDAAQSRAPHGTGSASAPACAAAATASIRAGPRRVRRRRRRRDQRRRTQVARPRHRRAQWDSAATSTTSWGSTRVSTRSRRSSSRRNSNVWMHGTRSVESPPIATTRCPGRRPDRSTDHRRIERPRWHRCVVRMPERDHVLAELQSEGIGAGIHYPHPVHLTGASPALGHGQSDFPSPRPRQRTRSSRCRSTRTSPRSSGSPSSPRCVRHSADESSLSATTRRALPRLEVARAHRPASRESAGDDHRDEDRNAGSEARVPANHAGQSAKPSCVRRTDATRPRRPEHCRSSPESDADAGHPTSSADAMVGLGIDDDQALVLVEASEITR